MSIWNQYIVVSSLEEAGASIKQAKAPAKFVAGGTDLLLEVQQNRHSPLETLVDLSHVPELSQLEIRERHLFIGAGVPVSQIASSELVRIHASAVATATGMIGGPQVRNSATLGGNVAHALPAADGMIALVALDAVAVIYSNGMLQEKPILTLFRGAGVTGLEACDILVGFKIKLKENNEASTFDRIMRPQGVALPILNTALWLKRQEMRIVDIRIVFGPSGATPSRAVDVESVMRGKILSEEMLTNAKACLRETVKFRTSKMRATADYRHELASVLLDKVFKETWKKAEE